MKVYIDLPYNGSSVTLLKMRNPWGRKGWKGDWSFYSSKWNANLRDLVKYNIDPQDGTFFIGLNDFIVYFDHLNICKVNLAYRNSYTSIQSSRYDFYETRFSVK